MASGYTSAGVDLDDLFAPRNGATPGPATGYTVNGVDLSDRYHPSLDALDRRADDVGIAVGGTDLRSYFRDIGYAGVTITAHPQNLLRAYGQSATFSVSATGEGSLEYQWQKDGADIAGATNSSYTIAEVEESDQASYRCVVSYGSDTVTSNAATLTAGAAPSITSHPSGGTITVGDVLAVSVTASGDAPLTYQWRKNGSNIGGATGSSYSFTTSSTGDSGSYDCVVSNAYGSATSSSASVTVQVTAPVITGGTVTGGPYNFTVGDVAVFTVTATGSGLSYQWKKDGSDIPGATGATYSLGATTHPNQSGTYSVVVSNAGGSDSASCSLTVADVAPVITGGTITGGPYSFGLGAGCNFTVTATGSNLQYAWYKNGVFTGHTSAQGPNFTAAEGDIGTNTYAVSVWNDAGEDNASTTLTISE